MEYLSIFRRVILNPNSPVQHCIETEYYKNTSFSYEKKTMDRNCTNLVLGRTVLRTTSQRDDSKKIMVSQHIRNIPLFSPTS